MGGRGTYASGRHVAYSYETVGNYNGVKILESLTNRKSLPEESHTSQAYLKLHADGTMNMLRIYDKDHYLQYEFGYHSEPKLTGNHKPVLHVHYYDHKFSRSPAAFVPKELFDQYKKWMKGRVWYDEH